MRDKQFISKWAILITVYLAKPHFKAYLKDFLILVSIPTLLLRQVYLSNPTALC